ncbi:NAD(P)/FAD-dependent oxidoreductase [Microbispora sp. H10830]|uniref:NAD(P)/FAD-dependent oxidoreductase n=1 Tax=Microbispora sp. H10830 TaxID=2729109 RepID=UPI00160122FB|nr:FAD-dependent oxidoreductase [Microbispora sp. H10830]
MSRAVVLGGGLAGVLAATVLAGHADEVVLIEGDRYPSGPRPRRGLPQSHHSHVLVAGGARALDALLPGTVDALLANGAHLRGLPGDALIYSADGWFRRLHTDAHLISCTRGLLDQVVRRRALGGGDVEVWEDTRALGLTGDEARITGVSVSRRGAPPETVRADLVVDATGRRSQSPRWLAQIGAGDVEEVSVATGLAYATRLYQAPGDLAAAIPAIMLHPGTAKGQPARGATLFPVEDGRWIVTLTGTRGGEPPTDEQGFTAFARSLRHPIVADLMAEATPLGVVRPYRDTVNRRRFFERARLPAGFAVVGDAAVAVNPVHSHGMSVAALGALRLREELARHGLGPSLFAGLQAALAAEAERSWRMAIEQDGERVTERAGEGVTERAGEGVTERAGEGVTERAGLDGAPRREPNAFEREIRARLAQAKLSSPRLAADFFGVQTLISGDTATDRSEIARVLTGRPEPLLTGEEAIGQYPALAAWRRSRFAAATQLSPHPLNSVAESPHPLKARAR